jgi:hypothetical protein
VTNPILSTCGPAPGREGPKVPSWANVADQALEVGRGHLVVVLAAVVGLLVLGLAWILVYSW